jgi:hypothetical protein
MKFKQGDIVAYIADPMNTGTDRAYICRVDNAGYDYVNMTHPHTADPTTPGTYYFHVSSLEQVVHAVVSAMEDPIDVGDTVDYVGDMMLIGGQPIPGRGKVTHVAQRELGLYITARFAQTIPLSPDHQLDGPYEVIVSGYSSDFVRVRTTPNRPKTLQDVVSVPVSDELAQPVPTDTPSPQDALRDALVRCFSVNDLLHLYVVHNFKPLDARECDGELCKLLGRAIQEAGMNISADTKSMTIDQNDAHVHLKRAVSESPLPDEEPDALVTARNALVTIDGEANDTRAGLLLAIDRHYDYVDLLAVNMELRDRLYDKDKMGELARTFLAALRKKKDDKNDQMPIVETSETRVKKEDES